MNGEPGTKCLGRSFRLTISSFALEKMKPEKSRFIKEIFNDINMMTGIASGTEP